MLKYQKNEGDSLIVQTVRFDDLLSVIKEGQVQEALIKINSETSKHYLCETGEQMLNQINIPFVRGHGKFRFPENSKLATLAIR